MTEVQASIDHRTLVLARKEAGFPSIEDAASRLDFAKKNPEKLAQMEAGVHFPTLNQLETIAWEYAINKGLLYLPPEQARQQLPDVRGIHDFRMGRDRRNTPELIRLLREVLTRQQLLGEVLDEEEVPDLSWIGTYRRQLPEQIAQALRRMVWQKDKPSTKLNEWIHKVEERLGVTIMQPHPHSSRSIKNQISGVAIDNSKVPIVVLNTKEVDKRRLFTLLHELAHLMIKAPGISKIDSESGNVIPENQQEERICDAVAAEVLMPEEIFNSVWDSSRDEKENIRHLSRETGASASACAVRACRLKQIDEGTMARLLKIYQKKYEEAQAKRKEYQERRKKENKKGGALSRSIVARDNVGPRMTLISLLAYDEGRISARDLYDIFGVKLKHLPKIAEKVDYELVRWNPPPGETSKA